jgi:DNA-directed RNA polymerase subunit RPC12/RpoP
MRCRQCGAECKQIGAYSHKITENIYEPPKEYKCRKCGAKYKVTDEVGDN